VPCCIGAYPGMWGAHLPFICLEPLGDYTAEVCIACPVRYQTYCYFPSRRASPLIDWYPIILPGDGGTEV